MVTEEDGDSQNEDGPVINDGTGSRPTCLVYILGKWRRCGMLGQKKMAKLGSMAMVTEEDGDSQNEDRGRRWRTTNDVL